MRCPAGLAAAALILAGPALAQMQPTIDRAQFAYEACAEIAIADEYLGQQFQRDHNVRAAAERALGTCQTEESAFLSMVSAAHGAFGNRQNMAVVDARAQVDQFRVSLKLRLVHYINEMVAGRR